MSTIRRLTVSLVAAVALSGTAAVAHAETTDPAPGPSPTTSGPEWDAGGYGPEWDAGGYGPEWDAGGYGPEWDAGGYGPEWDPENVQPGAVDLLENLLGGLF